MRNFHRTAAPIFFVYLVLAAAGTLVRGDVVLEAVNKVSLGQYRVYQVDIQDMGLGLYGGPAYAQGNRNRDGWAAGASRIDPNWTEGGTPGNLEARQYLVDQFLAMGLEVSVQGSYRNVVAELRGTTRPGDIYIVCAHYDTTSHGERPGGDDNASGTAGVLEAARVLTQYNPSATLRFIGFNAEEDWMLGSREYVDTVIVPAEEEDRVIGVLNLDMILRPGWDGDPQAPIDLDIETGDRPDCFAWARTFIDAIGTYVPSLAVDPASPAGLYWNAGDQGPFIAAGYPALMISENTAIEIWSRDSNAYYHQADDASDAAANDPANASGITYDYHFATDVVRAAVATLAAEAGIEARPSPGFIEYQAIPTNGAKDIESFSMEGDHYLAVANAGSDLTYDVNVSVYQWDGTVFAERQSIPSHGAADCEFFTIGDASYLAIANSRTDETCDVNSTIYRWDGTAFTSFQSLPTHGAGDWTFFTIKGSSFLAVANMRNEATHSVDSRIYKWNGTSFAEFQSIPTQGAGDWEFFTAGGASFLAVANGYDGRTYDVDSRVYKWDGTGFAAYQFVPTQGAADWESFSLDGEAYLAVANGRDDGSHSIDSRIYKWNGTRFVESGSIPTHGASDLEFFVIDGIPFLAAVNSRTDTARDAVSTVYRYQALSNVSGSSGFSVLRFLLGALPPNP